MIPDSLSLNYSRNTLHNPPEQSPPIDSLNQGTPTLITDPETPIDDKIKIT